MEDCILEKLMILNIVIPYRPLCSGFMQSVGGELHQLPDGRWETQDGRFLYGGERRPGNEKDELIRTISFINTNSRFRHNIIVAIDHNIYPQEGYLKQFDNVKIVKSKYVHQGSIQTLTPFQLNTALIEGISTIHDNEWACHCYLSDLICVRGWDEPLESAMQQYGDKYVYVPMFVEIRRGLHSVTMMGMQATPHLIWEEWRKLCCHSLLMPVPMKEYVTEDDINTYVKIINSGGKPSVIVEKPGDRIYGYFNVVIAKAKFIKRALRLIGSTFDQIGRA